MKKTIIWILAIIFLMSNVLAVTSADLEQYFTFDDADNSGGDPQDQSGNARHGGTEGATTGVTGRLGEAYSFDGNNDRVDSNYNIQTGSQTWAINAWVYRDAHTTNDWIAGNDCMDVYLSDVDHYIGATQRNDGSLLPDTGVDKATNWTMYTAVWDDSNNTFVIYMDGSIQARDNTNGNAASCAGYGDVYIGARTAAHYMVGDIDDFSLWSVHLGPSEIDDLYNGGAGARADSLFASGGSYPVNDTSWNVTSGNVDYTPTTAWGTGGEVNITSDLLSFTINTDVNSNMSCALDIGDVNYTTMIANDTAFKATTTNTTNHSITLSQSIGRGSHNVYCAFISTSGGIEAAGAQSGALPLNRVDIGPSVDLIMLNSTSSTNYSNGSINLYYETSASGSQSRFWYLDGVYESMFDNYSQISSSYVDKLDNWTAKVVAYNASESDEAITSFYPANAPPSNPTTSPQASLGWATPINLSCSGSTDIDSIDTITYEFWENHSEPVTLRQNTTMTTYSFALDQGNGTYKWQCRATDGETPTPYFGNYSLIYNTTELQDEAYWSQNPVIGGANTTYLFNTSFGGIKVDRVTAIFTIDGNNHNTKSFNVSGLNKTLFNVSVARPLVGVNTTYNYNWTLTAYFSNGSFSSYVYNGSQNVTASYIDTSCTGTTTGSLAVLNLSLLDEVNDTIINGDIDGTITYWVTGQPQNTNLTQTFSIDNVNQTYICLSAPDNSTRYDAFAQFRYESSGYDPRDYYLIRQRLDNVTRNFNLYLLMISLANGIDFTVEDQSSDPLAGRYIIIQRYDVSNNSYKTITILRTDDDGDSYAYLRKFDAEYLFKIQNDTTIEFLSDKRKITTDSLTFTIASQTYSQFIEDFAGISSVLTYNNVTKIFTASFAGAGEVSATCLKVVKHTLADGTEFIADSCTSDPSGTVQVDISANGNGTYIASLYVKENPEYMIELLEIQEGITHALQSLSNDLGKEGVVITLFGFVAVVTVAIATGSAVFTIMAGLFILVIFSLLGFASMTLSMVIGLVIVGGVIIALMRR